MTKRKSHVLALPADQEPWSIKRLRVTRKPLLPLSRPGPFFERLHHDIRNLIYHYLSLSAPLRFLTSSRIHSRFRETCRQAKQEMDEEGRRQLWVYLQKVMKDHLRLTGGTLRLSKDLKSKDDLSQITDLTILTKSPLPRLCVTLLDLAFASLKTLNVHCTDVGPAPPNVAHKVRCSFAIMISYIQRKRKYPRIKRLIFSWDYRSVQCRAKLYGVECTLHPQQKRWIHNNCLHTGDVLRKWPILLYGIDLEQRTGFIALELGSRCGPASTGMLTLVWAFYKYGFLRINNAYRASRFSFTYTPGDD